VSGRRVALITGATGALGAAAAAAFADEGWDVIGVDRIAPTSGDWKDFLVADLAEPAVADQVRALVELGRLDALVNNAALQVNRPLVETSDDEWRAVMGVNLDAAFRLIRGLHPALRTSRGSVVNVASVHALATSANVAAYAISKAALAGLTRTAAVELAADGIRCNAVLPGAVSTPMLHAGLDRRAHPEGASGNLRALVDRTPLGFVAEPAQIAPSIVFLADANRSPYTTGQLLVVDGGVLGKLGSE
jgi:NAD(P)-dependent dehydrogenase (short-subunit alcohol dehydrogenase family)